MTDGTATATLASGREAVTYAVEDGVAVIRLNNPPVNALSAAVRAGLVQAAERAAGEPGAVAVVIAPGDGTRGFSAGADITEFGKPSASPTLPEAIAALDALDKPVVAAIRGMALGGGLEVALGCHARVATPGASLGLPEVKLGLLPGAGGTQRLPRVIGPAAALRVMAEGEPLSADAALALGLVDEIADDEDDAVEAAKERALRLASRGGWKRARDAGGWLCGPGCRAGFEEEAKSLLARHRDNPSVAACVEAVRASLDLPFDEGMARERALFVALRDDPRSRALRHAFLVERGAARVAGLPRGTTARPVARAAVIGGGTMGGGIAMAFANAGLPVALIETDQAALDRGLARVASNYDASVKRGSLLAEAREERMGRIEGRVGLDAAAGADVVVEAVFEEMSVKREVFAALDRIARPGAVLATNTSYLDVDEIASATSRPADVLGMHFFSPANVMRLLEVVRGRATSPEALATAVELGRRLGKVPVVVGNCFGFVGNRMLSRRTAQAERLLIEGASPSDVDGALTGFGFRMGPFAMADLAGLDIGWRVRKATGKRMPVADALCEAGRLGQKAGKGYYVYTGREGRPDPEVVAVAERVAADQGVARREIGREEILDRLLLPMVDEAARILDEGIAARAGDVDAIWLHGYGWPATRGGPLFHADATGGPREVARRLDALAEATGDATLRPSGALRRLAELGTAFADAPPPAANARPEHAAA